MSENNITFEVDVDMAEIYTDPLPVSKDPLVPSIVFIVPYRDREEHHRKFSEHMKYILADVRGYKIYYIHQCDNRGFNRGAMKNIGLRVIKNKWPEDYTKITLVFNDIDCMPKTPGLLNYATTPNRIKHFYGFRHTLGGIFSINAGDFERINGFPNFWTWGYEDNMFQTRAQNAGIFIDRSQFYGILDPSILRLPQGNIRPVNKTEFDRYASGTKEGIKQIMNLEYSLNEYTGFVDVTNFITGTYEVVSNTVNYDLANGPIPFKQLLSRRKNASIKMQII